MALTPSELRRRKMNLLMAMSYAAFASTKASTWSPTLLFAAGEQGAWYDPSDFSTMFQDSAGTTPVTAVEQPVGLLLDKSKGLALGAELVTNGTFNADLTGWALGTDPAQVIATWTASGVSLARGAGGNAGFQQVIGLTAGAWYRINFTLVSGAVTFGIAFAGASATGAGEKTYAFQASTTTLRFWPSSLNSTAVIDNISVRELPGNHASQSTAASRPVLSARVNLLTYSEQFDNAAWTLTSILAFGSGSVANTTATLDPIGGNTADLITPNTTLATHAINQAAVTSTTGTSFTQSIYVKPNGYTKIALVENQITGYYVSYNLTGSGTVLDQSNATGTVTALSNGWYRITHVSAAGGASYRFQLFILSPSYTTGSYTSSWTPDGTSGIYLWGADLRVTNVGVGLPAYQRVGAAVPGTTNPPVTGVPDYDTSGFPLYLKFDGVDDSLATGSIDFSATDKMSVFAGLRKLSDATPGIILELSSGALAGTFGLQGPNASGTFRFEARGTATDTLTPTGFPAPYTAVLTGQDNIGAPSISLRVNSVQAASGTATQGTGNFSNNPLNIGRRNNTSIPFNGYLYSLIVRGALSTDAQIASTETWVNSKTGAY